MKFYDEIVTYYEDIFPLAEAKVEFVEALVKVIGGESLLDIGCATGSFCSAMVNILSEVDGFDLDAAMIEQAKKLYGHQNVRYEVGDMLKMSEVFPDKQYDIVTCFGNTLVHLNHEGVLQTFEGIKGKLKKDGLFIGQIINYDHVFNQALKALPPIDQDRISFDRTYAWHNEAILAFTALLRVKEDGAAYENTIDLYPIRKEQLRELLTKAGFKQIDFYKNYEGDEAEGKHLPLIFVAE